MNSIRNRELPVVEWDKLPALLTDRRILEMRKTTLEQEATKAKSEDNREKARRELVEVNKEIAAFDPVEPLRLFGGDVTPEKLADLLYAQNETFALVSAKEAACSTTLGGIVREAAWISI